MADSAGAEAERVVVTVLLDEGVVEQWLATGGPPPELVTAWDRIGAEGLVLRPMHLGSRSPALAAAYTVTVPSPEAADRALEVLRASPAVAGAYVKGPEALPSPGM